MRILTFTWNVGNKEPDDKQLDQWCPPEGRNFDLVVVGTQENQYKVKSGGDRSSVSRESHEDDSDDSEEELEDSDNLEQTAEQVKALTGPPPRRMTGWGRGS